MFGLLDALYSHLQRHLGARTDVADPAGGLNAKASDIRNQVGSNADAASTSGTVHAKLKAIPTSPIKSIQRGVFSSFPAGSQTFTLSSVNPAKCMVLLNGYATSDTGSYGRPYLSSLTSTALTVAAAPSLTANTNGQYSWQVIEFS